MLLVDSHCHLNFPDFKEDLDAVVARAREGGVGVMQTICTRMAEFPEIHALAQRYDDIYCSVGVHPNNVAEAPLVTVEELVAAAQHPKVIGLGETGLDYHYQDSTPEQQQESFRRHIEASRQTGLPVIIHTRDADTDTVEILQTEMAKGRFTGLIHCFTSTRYLAEESIKLGLYVSLSGILTFKNAQDIQATAKDLPLDRLLVETDAPYLAPAPHRGKRNEPSFTAHTNRYLAALKGLDEQTVAAATTANFFALFTKAQRPA
jgi:TatD DNase family protein